MAIKDILVQVDDSLASDKRLELACGLARQHGARLAGLHVIDMGGAGPLLFGDDIAAVRVIEDLRNQARERATVVEASFRRTTGAAGVDGEWVLEEGMAPDIVTLHARFVDLVVLGQNDPENTAPTANGVTIEHVLFASGRPVLMVPYAGTFSSVGQRTLVGWTPTREATRAVHDAIDLIGAGTSVKLLSIVGRGDEIGLQDDLTARMLAHLRRKGLAAEAHEAVDTHIGAGNILLNTAADENTDLLVVGAYGHSRLREVVMGGVTRTLLAQATIPVLMSH